jgi:hypothetical protein
MHLHHTGRKPALGKREHGGHLKKKKAKTVNAKYHHGKHLHSDKKYLYQGTEYSRKGLIDLAKSKYDKEGETIHTPEDAILHLGVNHVTVVRAGSKHAHA